MILGLSLLLVLGSVGFVLFQMAGPPGLHPGFEQMIHARIPWLLLGTIGAGVLLGIVALAQRRSLGRWLAVGSEVALGGLIAAYFVGLSFLPAHALAIGTGDAFPSYTLPAHDGTVHTVQAGQPRAPALYIFYRGDW